MNESIDPAHLVDDHRNVRELTQRMRIERSLLDPAPSAICIFDDVLTTGAHFKASEAIFLRTAFPHVPLAGLFLARRAPEVSPISGKDSLALRKSGTTGRIQNPGKLLPFSYPPLEGFT